MELKTLTHYAKTDVCFTINRNKILCELGHCVNNITCQVYAVETKILVGGTMLKTFMHFILKLHVLRNT